MTIETKYSIGDKVFWLEENQVKCIELKTLTARVQSRGDAPPEVTVFYFLDERQAVTGNALYATKEDLLNSL
jgi:hypothetical protein